MNDTKKFILTCFIVLIVVLSGYWIVQSLFNNRGTDGNIRESLGRITDEQRNAAESLERVERGLDDSTERISDINARVREHAEAVERIADSVERSKERLSTGEEILRDSQSRVTDCLRICSEVRATEKQN